MSDTNATDPDADTASGGTPEKPDQPQQHASEMHNDGSTVDVTDAEDKPVDNPAG